MSCSFRGVAFKVSALFGKYGIGGNHENIMQNVAHHYFLTQLITAENLGKINCFLTEIHNLTFPDQLLT